MPRIRVSAKQLSSDRHYQIGFSPRLASIVELLQPKTKRGKKARTVALYVGFMFQDAAVSFAKTIKARFPKAMLQVRASKRLGTPWEVKIRCNAIEMLIPELLAETPTMGDRVQRHIEQHRQRLEQQFDRSTAPTQRRDTGRTMVRCGDRFIGID